MKNMGDGRRVARVEKEVQATIAQYLIKDLRSELPGIVTVAHVKMPGDLRAAKVYVSVLGTEEEREEALGILQERAFDIQRFIGAELKMRFCPKLTFYADTTTDEILRVERILHDLDIDKKPKSPDSADGDDE